MLGCRANPDQAGESRKIGQYFNYPARTGPKHRICSRSAPRDETIERTTVPSVKFDRYSEENLVGHVPDIDTRLLRMPDKEVECSISGQAVDEREHVLGLLDRSPRTTDAAAGADRAHRLGDVRSVSECCCERSNFVVGTTVPGSYPCIRVTVSDHSYLSPGAAIDETSHSVRGAGFRYQLYFHARPRQHTTSRFHSHPACALGLYRTHHKTIALATQTKRA